jgi:hypothetical protein
MIIATGVLDARRRATPLTASSGHCVVIRRSLHASAEPPGRHGGSLAASDELWPALLIKVVKLCGSYAALDGCDLV